MDMALIFLGYETALARTTVTATVSWPIERISIRARLFGLALFKLYVRLTPKSGAK